MQYPHSIKISWAIEPEQDPVTLEYPDSAKAGPYTFECRSETNSEAKKVPGEDGDMIDYSFNVYMPRTDIQIPIGADYTLTNDSGVFSGKVKWSDNRRFNSRLWL